MEPFHKSIPEYRKQLEKGAVQKAYKGIMGYILELRADFKNKYPHYSVPGSLYSGYMDMTYFSLFPDSLKQRNLKIAIVFLHEAFRFEAWLAGVNKQVQAKYWQLFKESAWDPYHLVPTTKGADSILEHIIADQPDFCDLDALTGQIERETLRFIADVEGFLAEHEV